MHAHDVRHSDTELRLLRPLDEMSVPVRRALTRWLWEHDIAPSTVALGLPIERDDVEHVLIWREQRADGSVVKRWRFAPDSGTGRWPSRFPAGLGPAALRTESTSRHA